MTQYDVRGLWLLAIAGAEAVTIFASPLAGMILYLVLLLMLIAGGSLVRTSPVHRFYLALGLVPLIRIVSLSLPLSDLATVYSYAIMAVHVDIGAVVVSLANRITAAEIGLTAGGLRLQALVALAGVPIGLIDYLVLKPEPLIETLTWSSVVLPAVVLLTAAGFVENLVFRGVLQAAAESAPGGGWVYVALVSVVLQMGHRSAPHMVLALMVALLYGWTVKRTGSILGVCLSQGAAAIALYLVFPFVL